MSLFRTLAVTTVATVVAGAALAQTVSLGTGPAGSFSNNLGYIIAGAANSGAGLAMRTEPYDDTGDHFGLTSSGDLAFSLCNIQELHAVINGTGQFEDASLADMRAVARLAEIRVALFVRADSGIKSIAELGGKRVAVGYGSQTTEHDAMIALLNAGGLTTGDIVGVEVENIEQGRTAFLEGRVDAMMAFVFDPTLINVDKAVGKVGNIKMLEIPENPEAVEAMTKAFPSAYIATTNTLDGRPGFERLHSTRLPGVDHATRTMAYDVLISASTATDEELVYKMVKALAANKNAFLVTGEPQYLSFGKDTMATQYEGVDYHPGAIRYYQETGTWPRN